MSYINLSSDSCMTDWPAQLELCGSWGPTSVGPRPLEGWKGAQEKQYWKGTRVSPSSLKFLVSQSQSDSSMKPSSLVITAAHVFSAGCWPLESGATEILLPSPPSPPATQQEEGAGTGTAGGGGGGGVSTLPTPEVEPRLETQLVVAPTNSLQ